MKTAAESAGQDVVINRIGSMGTVFFTKDPVFDFASAKRADGEKYKKYYSSMLEQGIYLAPSPFEAVFVSSAHDDESIQKTIECAGKSFERL